MRGHAQGPFSQQANLRVQYVMIMTPGQTQKVFVSASKTDPVLLKIEVNTDTALPTGTNALLLGNPSSANAYLASGDTNPGSTGFATAKKFVIVADTELIAVLTSTAVAASKALTISSTTSANTQTVTIGATTYTFNTSLTNTANNVLIGVSAGAMGDNLAAAINAGAGSGTLYGAGTVANASVTAVSNGSGVVTVTAKVAGTGGNSTAISETLTNSAWAGGATALSGGANASTTGQMTLFLDA